MPKPPASPPSSDISGVDRDRISRTDARVFDKKAQRQMAAEAAESKGRPDGAIDGN
jgi:hypothetical protein